MDEASVNPETLEAALAANQPSEEPTVEILKGVFVPQSSVAEHHSRDCRKCTGGWVSFVIAGDQRRRALCDCALLRARRKIGAVQQRMAVQASQPASPPPVQHRETARAHERLRRLGAELEAIRAEVAERQRAFEEVIAPIEAERRADLAKLQDASSDEIQARAQVDRLTAEVTEAALALALKRERLAAAEGGIVEAEHMRTTLRLEVERCEALIAAERERFDGGVARLQRDIAKLERRMAGVRIYNPGVDRPEPVVCAT